MESPRTSSVGFLKAGHLGTLLTALLYFDFCFAIWVLNAAMAPFISEELNLSPAQKGLMMSVPVIAGALLRVPIGLVAQVLGRKRSAQMQMAVIVVGLFAGWLLVDSFAGVMAMGVLLGVAGASFGVALSLGAGWYPPEHRGLAMGIAGAGNSGAVLAVLFAPPLAEAVGWRAVYGVAVIPIVVAMVMLQIFAKEPPDREHKKLRDYGKLLVDRDAWILNLVYMVTFGGYIGLTSFLPTLFHDQYGIAKADVGRYAAAAIVAGSLLRVVGGGLADRFGGARVLVGLMVIIVAAAGAAATVPENPIMMVAILVVGFAAMGAGNGAVFQLVSLRFASMTAVAGSLVGEIGALAGGFLPAGMGLAEAHAGGYGPGFATVAVLAMVGMTALVVVGRMWSATWARGRRARAGEAAAVAGVSTIVAAVLLLAPGVANADEAPAIVAVASRPPPYALPFQLRPVAPSTVVRSDTTLAGYSTDAGSGTTVASTFLASYKLTPKLAPLVRIAVVDESPATGSGAMTMSNPLLGVVAGRPLTPDVKLGLFGAVTLPIGSGGGDSPDAAQAAANKAGIAARSSMDNAMFAVNDAAIIGGADLAWVKGGVTVQAELTVFQLARLRGAAVQPDAYKTNLTSGIHAGWYATPWLSLGTELRYQRWLSTPAAVAADTTGVTRDNLTAAAGVRGHIELSGKRWVRPGVSYTRPIDDPMSGKGYDIIQVDVPLAF